MTSVKTLAKKEITLRSYQEIDATNIESAWEKHRSVYAGKEHQNFKLPYLQEYVKKYGVRKCEANAVHTYARSIARHMGWAKTLR